MALKVAVATDKPEEAIWAARQDLPGTDDASGAGSEPETPRGWAAERAFTRLLRTSALTGEGGRADLLYAILFIGLDTATAGYIFMINVQEAISRLAIGSNVFKVAAMTGFFGLMFLFMWISLLCCFVTGRRRYGQLLLTIKRTLRSAATFSGYKESTEELRRGVTCLLVTAVGLIVFTAAAGFHALLTTGICDALSLKCILSLFYGVTFTLFYVRFHLIPLKFVFTSMQLTSGFRIINAELRAAVKGKAQPKSTVIDQLTSLQDDLSQTFATLIKYMSLELVAVIAYGTISSVSMWLLFIFGTRDGGMARDVPIIGLYLVGAGITVLLPCEMIQRALNTVGQTRDLLLATERQQPQLSQQLTLFRETVGRDLDTLGDLGLFRLQRSTILSISATILTYIIVMVQFYGSEIPASGYQSGVRNMTDG